MAICSCNTGAVNSGYACAPNGGVPFIALFFNKFKEDGTINGIDFDADSVDGKIPKSVIDGKIYDANDRDRWFPVGNFENVEDTRAEGVFQTFNGGNTAKIKEGVRSFTGLLPKKTPKYKTVFDRFSCQTDIAVMFIDLDGNLIGESLDGNILQGLKVDSETLNAVFVKTTDAEVNALMVTYMYSQAINDANIQMIGADDIDFDIKSVRGILDAKSTGSATVTEFTTNVYIEYGSTVGGKIGLSSLVAGDFVLNNKTTSSLVTIDSVDLSDSDEGNYVLSYSTGVTVADVLELTIDKQGYEMPKLTVTVA